MSPKERSSRQLPGLRHIRIKVLLLLRLLPEIVHWSNVKGKIPGFARGHLNDLLQIMTRRVLPTVV